jgi:hypothetical protein
MVSLKQPRTRRGHVGRRRADQCRLRRLTAHRAVAGSVARLTAKRSAVNDRRSSRRGWRPGSAASRRRSVASASIGTATLAIIMRSRAPGRRKRADAEPAGDAGRSRTILLAQPPERAFASAPCMSRNALPAAVPTPARLLGADHPAAGRTQSLPALRFAGIQLPCPAVLSKLPTLTKRSHPQRPARASRLSGCARHSPAANPAAPSRSSRRAYPAAGR